MQQQAMRPGLGDVARDALAEGAVAAALSAATLAWRGRSDSGSAVAPINAPSHWLWGREAIRSEAVDARHTALGAAVHGASSVFWSGLYAWIGAQRRRPTVGTVVLDAVAVTALAAVVDLKLVPERLSPGFQHRVSRGSLALVYGSFAAGLALGGLRALARRRR